MVVVGGSRAVPGRRSHGMQVQTRGRVTSSARSHAVSIAERWNCKEGQQWGRDEGPVSK